LNPDLRAAVLGSSDIQTPTSPLGSFPELSQLYQSSFQLPQATGAANILTNQAQQQVAEAKAAAAAKKDKSKYQRVKKKDGGFAFYDPDGNEISAYDFANATDTNPTDALKDSENPIDIGYQQDYKNLQDYMSAKLNSKQDEESAKIAQDIEARVKEAHGIDLSSLNPQQLIDQFKQAYPTVYGGKKAGVPVGQTLVPRRPSSSQIDLTGTGNLVGAP
jgi:hypothetical protein